MEFVALSSSQRINLIKEIASRLEGEEWPLVDLILDQFSLPTTESWNGSKLSYVLHMLKEASDETLVALGIHVGYEIAEPPPSHIEPAFWEEGYFRVFISHLSAHKEFAATLQESLRQFGISGFIAHNDIEPTAEWQTQIETALATCDALVALLNKDFHTSYWTDQEIGFAMGRGVPVFSIRLGQDPYGFIGRFQAFNGAKKTPLELATELFDTYRKNKQTQQKMARVLIKLFVKSHSFSQAKQLIKFLEELETWEPGFSKLIQYAAKNNSQVEGSWGVSERVKALVKKWQPS